MNHAAFTRLDASAITLTELAPSRSRMSVISPLVVFVGFAVRRPVADTILPSSPSARPAGGTARGTGSDAVPAARKSAVLGRISSCPYGAASLPLTSISVPRANVGASSGRRTTSPASTDAIARSGGLPRRPASATTTPLVWILEPTGRPRAAASDKGAADGLAVGAGVGTGVGVGDGDIEGVGEGLSVAVGTGVGDTVADGVGTGVGDGVAAGVTSSSPGRVAWTRYPAIPVPELSRCPSGPTTTTLEPETSARPAAASGPMTARTGPDPSSTVIPRPSDSWSGEAVTVPAMRIREPSADSVAEPVGISMGSGMAPDPSETSAVSASRSVRCENRLSSVPVAVTVEPAGQSPMTAASR